MALSGENVDGRRAHEIGLIDHVLKADEHLDPDLEVIHPQDGRHHWPMANAVSELSDGSLVSSSSITAPIAANRG